MFTQATVESTSEVYGFIQPDIISAQFSLTAQVVGRDQNRLQIYLIKFTKCIGINSEICRPRYIPANRILGLGRRRPILVGDHVDHRPRFHLCATPIDRGH